MTRVCLGLGSNVDAPANLRSGLDALLLRFHDLAVSWVFESEAVGCEGANFLNLAVAAETDLPLTELSALLKAIEDKHGRLRGGSGPARRSLDIDILLYGKLRGDFGGIELPRPEITENAFVLWPLSQVAGTLRDPLSGRSYRELWEAYAKDRQRLWPVDFDWHGRKVSRRSAR